MIELTKQQFDTLLRNLRFRAIFRETQVFDGLTDDDIRNGLIIVKYHLQVNVSNNLILNYTTNKNPVFLFRANDFTFTDPNILDDYMDENPHHTPTNFNWDTTNDILSYTPESSSSGYEDYVLVYFETIALGANHPVFNFNGTNIKSIDFIGGVYHELNFTTPSPFLEVVDLGMNTNTLIPNYGTYDGKSNMPIYNGISDYSKVTFAANAFAGTPIKKMVFPEATSMYTIPEGCFAGCNDLLEVWIGPSVTMIGANAFKKCTNLRYVYIGGNVTTIGAGAFEECTYPSLEFETPHTQPKFLGEKCALLRKNTDKTYSVIHATTDWMLDWRTDSHYVYYAADLPSYITPETQHIGAFFADTEGGNIYNMTDIHGNTFTGTIIDTEHTNSSRVNGVRQDGTLRYAMPIFKLVKSFEPRACINTTMPHLRFRMWETLESIGQEAFKGTFINFQFPPKYGFNLDTTHDYSTDNFYIQSYNASFIIGVSAFENSSLTTINVTKNAIWGTKAFYNCQQLLSINFREFTPDTSGAVIDGSGVINYSSSTNYNIGKLCFGNTPSLQTITCSQNPNYNTVAENAIYKNGSNNNGGYVLVGCKSTDLASLYGHNSLDKIAENAFYGCTTLNWNSSNNVLYGYKLIGNSAFYACSGIVSTESNILELYTPGGMTIAEKAFYGCTGITYLYINPYPGVTTEFCATLLSKAFANSGVNKIVVGNYGKLILNGLDAFDGCVLNTVSVNNITYGEANVVDYSNIDDSIYPQVHNALLVCESTNPLDRILVKSGTGKDIVNTADYADMYRRSIKTIKANAFTGVNLNDGNNTTIHIPKTVQNIETSILDGSKTDNLVDGSSNNPCDLKLDGDITDIIYGYYNNGQSYGLLYLLGGRYFKKIVEDTASYQARGLHYYTISQGSSPYPHIDIIEGYSGTYIGCITYWPDGSGAYFIEYRFDYKLDWDYMAEDTDPHVTQLPYTNYIVLMWPYRVYTQNEMNYYGYGGITPGTVWQGITIPDDIQYECKVNRYTPYDNLASGAFSNCKWIRNVYSQKILNAPNLFKGCTNLLTVRACDTVNSNSGLNQMIFDGKVYDGTFENCGMFRCIEHTLGGGGSYAMQYPVIFGANSFKNCTSFWDEASMFENAISFGESSFDGAHVDNIFLTSVCNIHPTAFDNCSHVWDAGVESTCGYYFTGEDGHSIVNNENKIVVGTEQSNVNSAKGIEAHAFHSREYYNDAYNPNPYTIELAHKIGYTIGEEAFSKSNITSYTESDCSMTSIGKGAFKNCTELTTISLGESAKISESSFEGCGELYNVALYKMDIPRSAFKKCVSLERFIIQGSVDSDAFNGCTKLSYIKLDYLTTSDAKIDATAFIDCPLNRIELPLNVDKTRNYIFDENTGMQTPTTNCVYEYDSDNHLRVLFGVKDFDIQNKNAKIIGANAFNGRGITGAIVIPGSVTKIEDSAFANNTGITSVTIPPTVEYIGANAFAGCTNLDMVVLPDSCKFVGAGAFNGCPLTNGFNCNAYDVRYGTSLSIQATQLTGGSSNIKGSLDLRNVNCFNVIGPGAFKNSNIQVIKLPLNCIEIVDEAFESCNSLVELHFNTEENYASLSIHNRAFYGCSYLGDIYLHTRNIPTLDSPIQPYSHFYGVGGSIPQAKRHLHVTRDLQGVLSFLTSDFYKALVTDNNFTVIYDLYN